MDEVNKNTFDSQPWDIAIGAYNFKHMAAVMVFEDSNCRGRSRRFFYTDPKGKLSSDYANADVGLSNIKGVMVSLGLRLTIFDDDVWLTKAEGKNYS